MHTEHDYRRIDSSDLSSTCLAELTQGQQHPLWFSAVDFSEQDLSRINLSGARFERCLFAGTNLTAAQLDATEWLNCKAAHAVFRASTLVDARFVGSDLNNTRWQHSKLAHASFTGCKLTGANFADAATLGLNFSDCVLRSASLSGMSFYKSQLHALDFAEADLSYCDFRHAVFVEAGSLSLARVNNARFDHADLREASLDGLRLVDAKLFKGATISKSQAAMLLSGLGLTVR